MLKVSRWQYRKRLLRALFLGLGVTAFAMPTSAGGLDLGGLLGGTLDHSSGGIRAKADASIGTNGADATARASLGKSANVKAKVVLLRKHTYKAHRRKHRELVKLNAKVVSHPVYAKLRLALGKKNNVKGKITLAHTHAKVFAKLGGDKPKAKAVAKAEVLSAKVKVRIGIGSANHHPTTSAPPRSPTAGTMASRLDDLSRGDRDRLVTRCVTVLAAPEKFDDDLVSLCKMITTL